MNPDRPDLRPAAQQLAIETIRQAVEAGCSVEHIQSTYHYSGGPDYQCQVVAEYQILVTKVNGQTCRQRFKLRQIYRLCKSGQLSLF